MDHANAADIVLFHMDGNVANILAESDNDTTDVAPVDTTIDNDVAAGAYKDFKVIAHPSGVVELWIDGARVLEGTTFTVRPTANLHGYIGMEKTSDNTSAVIKVDRMRVAGARV